MTLNRYIHKGKISHPNNSFRCFLHKSAIPEAKKTTREVNNIRTAERLSNEVSTKTQFSPEILRRLFYDCLNQSSRHDAETLHRASDRVHGRKLNA